MVKTPRTRHSKTEKEPVTIDLAPGEVSRVKAEAENAAAQPEPRDTASESPAAEAVQPEPLAAKGAQPEAGRPEATVEADGAAARKGSAADSKPAHDTRTGEAPGMAGSVPPSAARPTEAERDTGSAAAAARGQTKPAKDPSPAAADPGFGRQGQAAPRPAPPRRGGALAAGVAGGVIALLLAGGLQYAGLLPGGTRVVRDDSSAAVAALEAQLADLRAQVDALGTAGEGALDGRVAQAEERVATLASELDALRGQVAALGTGEPGEAPAVDLGPIETRIAALETMLAALGEGGANPPDEALAAVDGQISVLSEAIAALRTAADAAGGEIAAMREELAAARQAQATAETRVDALEQAMATLTGRVDEQAEMPGTALVIAASALKAAIDRGTPFATELDTYASLTPDAPEIAELRAYAATGVPTRARIAAEADAAANAMIAAARPIDPEAGLFDRLWASAMGLVQVRPIGMVEGEDVPEVVARLDAAVQAGDYERALAEFATLPAPARAAGETFMARVQARHAADRLVDQALAAALKA